MNRTLLAILAAVALAAGGFFGWRAYSARGDAAGSGGNSPAASVSDSLRSLASAAARGWMTDDRPIRCRIGKREHLLRRLDCAQQHGIALEGGGGGYMKLTKEEMEARSGAPKLAAKPDGEDPPPAAPANGSGAGNGSRGALR